MVGIPLTIFAEHDIAGTLDRTFLTPGTAILTSCHGCGRTEDVGWDPRQHSRRGQAFGSRQGIAEADTLLSSVMASSLS